MLLRSLAYPQFVVKRLILFFVWGFLGMVLSYGLLYLFTPFGMTIIAFVAVAGLLAPRIDGSRWPEALGLAAGPGAFCVLIASTSDVNAIAYSAVGAAIIGVTAAAYLWVGHARCVRNA